MKEPKVRFKGFTDDWEQRKLGEVMSCITDYVAAGSFADIKKNVKYMTQSGYAQLVRTVDLKNKFENNDFVYVDEKAFDYLWRVNLNKECIVLPNIGANIGEVYYIEPFELPFENNVLGPNAILLKTDEDNYFIFTTLITASFQSQLFENVGSSGQPKFNKTELKTININLPNMDEQKRLGQYFSSLDRLITLHQRKCEETKTLKKYMLQKMFPQNGMNVPEIRFEGYTDAWEQRKLGEVAIEFKSGVSLRADEIEIEGAYPVYGGNGLRGYTSTYNHDGEFTLIGRQGALCGNMNYSVGKAYFTEHAVVVQADENNDTRFIYYLLDTMQLGQYSDQSAQPGLAVNKLIKLENLFPNKLEQVKISTYFSELDTLITLHQQKCDELQNIKKFMLQNMFV